MTFQASASTVPPCPVCQSTATEGFFELRDMPLHCNLLWESREKAMEAPRGNMELVFCRGCGHVYNGAFQPELMEYSEQYENSLHFSPCFQGYATELARRLVDRYRLHDKHVVEIGCGKGEFLVLLSRMGNNQATGFDPSYRHGRTPEAAGDRVRFVQDFYGTRYADQAADLVVCRHVLEHIRDPRGFLADIRQTLNGRSETAVFFEVPDTMFILRDLSIWDLLYEHCSYYTMQSLTALFELSGFRVTAVESVFSGQFLTIEAQPCATTRDSITGSLGIPEEVQDSVDRFAGRFQQKVETWNGMLREFHLSGHRVVVWGAGSKGAGFLNMVPGAHRVECVVDINPHKQGKYMAGAGQPIVSPDALREYEPRAVLVMNAAYLDEIGRMVGDMGLAVELLTV